MAELFRRVKYYILPRFMVNWIIEDYKMIIEGNQIKEWIIVNPYYLWWIIRIMSESLLWMVGKSSYHQFFCLVVNIPWFLGFLWFFYGFLWFSTILLVVKNWISQLPQMSQVNDHGHGVGARTDWHGKSEWIPFFLESVNTKRQETWASRTVDSYIMLDSYGRYGKCLPKQWTLA